MKNQSFTPNSWADVFDRLGVLYNDLHMFPSKVLVPVDGVEGSHLIYGSLDPHESAPKHLDRFSRFQTWTGHCAIVSWHSPPPSTNTGAPSKNENNAPLQ